MIKILVFVLVLLNLTNLYSQDSNSVERPFIDTTFVFKHYDNLIIKESIDKNNNSVFDTVYSWETDLKGNTIAVCIDGYKNLQSGNIIYENNKKGQRIREIHYLSQGSTRIVGELISIEEVQYSYNDFDSLSIKKSFKYSRTPIMKDDTISIFGKKLIGYTNDWSQKSLYTTFLYKYNENKKIAKMELHTDYGFESDWNYFYNTNGKKIKENYCKHAFDIETLKILIDKCQMSNTINYNYSDSIMIKTDSAFSGMSNLIAKSTYHYSKEHILIKVKEEFESFDLFNNGSKYSDGYVISLYKYDGKGRISEQDKAYKDFISNYSFHHKYHYHYNNNTKANK